MMTNRDDERRALRGARLVVLLCIVVAHVGCDPDVAEPAPADHFRDQTPQVEAILSDERWDHIYNDHVLYCPRPGFESRDTCFLNPAGRSEAASRAIITEYIQQVVDEAEEGGWLPDDCGKIWGEAGEDGEIIGTQGETEVAVVGRQVVSPQGVFQFQVVTAYPRRSRP